MSYEDDCNEYYFGIPFKKRVSVEAVARAEPAYEPKFKVGDRVRTLTDWGDDAPKGSIGVVSNAREDGGVNVKIDGGDDFAWFFQPDEIEPAPKFKVGDRVRFTDAVCEGWFFKAGGTGNIVDIADWDNMGIVVSCDSHDGDTAYVSHEHIELLPTIAIGDRVKLKRHFGPHAVGDGGKVRELITKAGFVNAGVEMDPWGVYTVFPVEVLETAVDCAVRKEQQDSGMTLGDILATALKQGPKFKAGDVVRALVDDDLGEFKAGNRFVVTDIEDGYIEFFDGLGDKRFQPNENYELVAYSTSFSHQPAIVARVLDGQPRPSNIPFVHASSADALQEAERLAKNNPGQEFAVYQRVGARVAVQHIEMKEVA
jgi:hypothetical protein